MQKQMEDQDFVSMNRRDAEIVFTSAAINGLLASNSEFAKHAKDLAEAAVNIGRTAAAAMFKQEEAVTTEN